MIHLEAGDNRTAPPRTSGFKTRGAIAAATTITSYDRVLFNELIGPVRRSMPSVVLVTMEGHHILASGPERGDL